MKHHFFRLLLGLASIVVVAVSATTASAATPRSHGIKASTTISDATFLDAYLTQACGFDVNDTLNAFTTALGVVGSNGDVVFEFDTWSGTWTYSAPGSGKSVTQPLQLFVITSYGSGAELGSNGVSTSYGPGSGTLFGGPPGATLYKVGVQVVGFDVTGIPFAVPSGAAIAQQGNIAGATAAICAALA